MTKPKLKTPHPSPTIIEKFFLAAIAVTFVMQVGQAVYMMAQQGSPNDSFAAYFSWFLGISVSILIWLTVYFSRRKRQLSLKAVSDVTLVTFSTIMLATGLSWLVTFLPLRFTGHNPDSIMLVWSALYTGLPLIVSIPALIYVILRLRETKQW